MTDAKQPVVEAPRMAPVNPEGQTAREQRAKKLADQVVEQGRYYNGLARIPLEELLFKALTEEAAQPSEGQTAQEVKHAALMEGAAYLERHGFVSAKAPSPAAALRILASTPSPAKQEQKIASAEGVAAQLGAAPATPLCGCVRCAFPAAPAQPNARDARADTKSAVLRAYDAIQRGDLNYAEEVLVSLLSEDAGPPETRADARDAEIARLREERDFERGQRDLRHAAYIEERDKAARLTNELEEARAAKAVAEKNELRSIRRTRDAEAQAKALLEALRDLFWDNFPRGVLITRAVCTAPEWRAYQLLAPPEPKAETPAETGRSIQFEGPAGGTGHPLIDQGRDARKPDGREPDASGAVGLPPCGEQQDSRSAGPSVSETAGQKEGR